jgi:hypothetical protein
MALNPNILLTNYTSNPLRIGKKISGQEDFLAPEFSCQKRGELLSLPQTSPVAFVCYCPPDLLPFVFPFAGEVRQENS